LPGSAGGGTLDAMTLKERVDAIFPDWQRWYPSLFDAAVDLGVIRARVCDPSSLLLSNRHASVRAAAEHAHRRKWSAEENEPEE
jgi:hypothetical protein